MYLCKHCGDISEWILYNLLDADMNISLKHHKVRSRELVLLYHLALIMSIMTLCRVVFYVYNYSYFNHIKGAALWEAVCGGALFDGAAIAYSNSLYFLLLLLGVLLPVRWERSRVVRIVRDASFLIPNLLNIFLNISDTGYYPFALKRTSLSVFTEFANENVANLYGKFVVLFWPLTLCFIGLVVLLFVGYYFVRLDRTESVSPGSGWRRCLLALVEVMVLGLVAFFTIRGKVSFLDRPMKTLHANNFVNDPRDRDLVLNTMFTMIRTSQQHTLKEYNFMPPEEIGRYFSPLFQAKPLSETDSLYGAYRGKNVVLILLEGFAREYTGFLNRDVPGYPSYTPFLDSLMSESLVFGHAFANGRVSIDAMPAALTALPSLDVRFVSSHYAGNKQRSLPELLARQGYTGTFYHGAPKGSMAFDAFVKQIGVKKYFGLKEHGNDADFDGSWGIFDEPFLQSVAGAMMAEREPFFATIFTLSSHTPYRLPDAYKGAFDKGTLPIHPVVQYADMALARFFGTIRTASWFDNTLFVLMADHATASDRPEYQNVGGRFAIPIIFYDPKGGLKGEIDEYVVQQSDLLPTILYLMGDTTPIISYGSNMLDKDAPHYSLNCENDTFIMLHRDFTLSMSRAGESMFAPPSPLMQHPLSALPVPLDSIDVKGYEWKLKAIVQDFTRRVIQNDLVPAEDQ